jgi:transposase
VWAIHANYRKNGLDGLVDGRGGRYRENLSIAEEEKLLVPFEEESKNDTLVVAKDLTIPPNIRLAYLPPYSPNLNPTEHI